MIDCQMSLAITKAKGRYPFGFYFIMMALQIQ
jgi:hypothetical protein